MRPLSGSSSSQRSADIRRPRGRGRGRGGVVGNNPARPFAFGQPATIRPTNLLGIRTPRQSASASTLVGNNGSHCYVPQPPVIPPPHVDVTPMEELVGNNPAQPFAFGQPATIRPTNLLGNRTPSQSASASTLVGNNGSHAYVPQPPVIPPPHVDIPPPHVDVTPMEEQQQGHVEWTADELYGMLNENELNVDEIVPDSQHVGDGDENVHRDTSRDPMADTDYENASGQEGWTPETVQLRQRPILRGGSSTGGRNDEDTPIDEVRPFIVPAGDDSFDPSACVKRIGMECIGPYFKVGWTTMETCDRDAPEIWFDHFKTIVRWEPIHTHQIKANFRRKCSKIISDAWYSMRNRKSKGPKWATPDVKAWAKEKFKHDDLLQARSARNKINYKGLKSGRGPSKHVLGPKPMTFHKLLMEKKLKRQVMPVELYRKAKQRKDGSFVTSDSNDKLTQLERVEREVRQRHERGAIIPEGEFMEATGDVMGFSSRSGLPNLYGSTATLEPSSQWSCTQSTPSVTSQIPTQAAVEEIVQKAVEERIQPAISQIQERFDTQQQPDMIDSRLSQMEERIDSQFQQMRMLIQMLQSTSSAATSETQPQGQQGPRPNS